MGGQDGQLRKGVHERMITRFTHTYCTCPAAFLAGTLLWFCVGPALCDWDTEYPDPWSEADIGKYSSIALDSVGYPQISYYDETNGDLKYACKHTTEGRPVWSATTVDTGGTKEVGLWTSIALDSSDRPHISYYNATDGTLKYAHYNGTSWSITTVDRPSRKAHTSGVGWYTSICLSGSLPHISYYDSDHACLRYAYFDGSSWHRETVDSGESMTGLWTSIEMGSDGYPRIAYCTEDDDEVRVAYKDTSGWHVSTVYSGSNLRARCTSLYVDTSNNDCCFLSYTTASAGFAELSFARGDPAHGWDEPHTHVGMEPNAYVVNNSGTAIWMNGTLAYIVYPCNWLGYNRLRLACRTACEDDPGEQNDWCLFTVWTGGGVVAGQWPGLAVDASNCVHVSSHAKRASYDYDRIDYRIHSGFEYRR